MSWKHDQEDGTVGRSVNAIASRKVELAIGQLEALSVPPCIAVQYLSEIQQERFRRIQWRAS